MLSDKFWLDVVIPCILAIICAFLAYASSDVCYAVISAVSTLLLAFNYCNDIRCRK